jgi:hypothetical protein
MPEREICECGRWPEDCATDDGHSYHHDRDEREDGCPECPLIPRGCTCCWHYRGTLECNGEDCQTCAGCTG